MCPGIGLELNISIRLLFFGSGFSVTWRKDVEDIIHRRLNGSTLWLVLQILNLVLDVVYLACLSLSSI